MIAGVDKYFESITVQRMTSSTDSWGNPVAVWSDYSTIQGRIRQLNSKELFQQKDSAVASHRLYTRHLGLLITDRIKYNSKIYEVKGINNVMHFGEFVQVELWQTL